MATFSRSLCCFPNPNRLSLALARRRARFGAPLGRPLMTDDRPAFERGVIRPMQCFKDGWQLIKDDYWLFLGMTVVAMLIAGAVPLGILAGPMMCGLYYCLFRRARGKEVKFEMLFRGFDYFVQSLIATLIQIVPFLVVFIPAYIAFMAVVFSTTIPNQPVAKPDPGAAGTIMGAYAIFILLIVIVSLVFAVLFFFTYPLIVDGKLTGVQAVLTSMRAARANLGGVVGVVLLNMLLGLLGYLACCVGIFFILPLHFAAIAVAYRAVFPEAQPEAPPDDAAGDYDDARLEDGPA